MPLMKRELARRATGPVSNDEDWWRLVFDTDAGRLYVEHEWAYADVRRGGPGYSGVAGVDVAEFLNEGGRGASHRELLRLISTLFETTPASRQASVIDPPIAPVSSRDA
jgi:hypothetical protein